MNQPATIKLFLTNGSPNSLRTAELSNWSGKAVSSPRTELSDLYRRDELKKPGVYILTGISPDSGEPAIYIGESEDVIKRLKQHSSKDFWNAATVFVSKDENLTKAHIKYLEGRLIRLATEAGNSEIMNGSGSGSKLPESDQAEMDVFLAKCLQLLPVLGVTDFHIPSGSASGNEQEAADILYTTIKGLKASGKRTPNGFVVFSGSQAVLEHRASAKSAKVKRAELLDKGKLVSEGDYLVFTKDVEFGSPSAAGRIVHGGSVNGLTVWKDIRGKTLKDLEKYSE